MMQYNISSPDIAVELLIVSQQSEQFILRHALSGQPTQLNTEYIPISSTDEPIFLILNAFFNRSIATYPLSSVTIHSSKLQVQQHG